MPSKRKTPRRPVGELWPFFHSRDSLQDLQDMHDLEQAQTVPSPDPMQPALDALERAWAQKKQKTPSERAAEAAIKKARASARHSTKKR